MMELYIAAFKCLISFDKSYFPLQLATTTITLYINSNARKKVTVVFMKKISTNALNRVNG